MNICTIAGRKRPARPWLTLHSSRLHVLASAVTRMTVVHTRTGSPQILCLTHCARSRVAPKRLAALFICLTQALRFIVSTTPSKCFPHSTIVQCLRLQTKRDAGELTQQEFDLILGTHHLGEDAVSPDAESTHKPLPCDDQQLSFGDLQGYTLPT